MKIILVILASLLPAVAYSIGEGGDTEWPKGATIEVQLSLSATVGTNGQVKVSGDLLIKNPSVATLTIQNPHNRLVLAFLVFDPLGNPVAPQGLAKVDPAFRTYSLSGRSTYTHHFESLDFITGSALFGYELNRGKSYKILAVYRPAGPHGPGFTSPETELKVPNLGRFAGDPHLPASSSDAVVAWGEPVEGVSVRMRADKTSWVTNERPTFKFDVRNQGQREFYTFQAQESGRLEVDGVWYGWTGGFDLKGSGLPPGRAYHDIPVSLGSNWKATQEWRDKTQAPPPQIPLKLLPGKHAIRFAPEIRDIPVKPKPQNNYVPSNPVEIETGSNLKRPAEQGDAESTPTNSFGIYLTAEPVDRRITAYGNRDWSRIRLSESPVISATDIISYDFTNHSMRLRAELLAKFPRPPVEGTPFIVVANGERIYLGAFTTILSSMSFAVPCIEVDARTFVTNQPADTAVIYPGAARGAGPDPRGDRRIKTALSALHKLE